MYLNWVCENWIKIIISLLVFLIVYFYLYMTRNNNYWKKIGIPYEPPYPIVGCFGPVFTGKLQVGNYLKHLYRKFPGPYFGVYILDQPVLLLKNPAIVKRICTDDYNYFEDRSFACDESADNVFAKALFIAKYPEYEMIKKKVSGGFTPGKIKQMLGVMMESSEELERYLETKNNEIVDVIEIAHKYITNVVAACFFGINLKQFPEKEQTEFKQAYKNAFDFNFYRAFCFFSHLLIPKCVSLFKLKFADYEYFKNIFLENVSYRDCTGFKANDFVDFLINIRDNCDREDKSFYDTNFLLAQALTFIGAGYEVTRNLLIFTLYEMGLNPNYQQKLRKEINDLFSNDAADITFEKIQQMKYLNMVTSETLRLYPLAQFLNRMCTKDYVIKETGLKVTKGTHILVSLSGIHHDEAYYKNAESFNPERFQNGHKDFMNSGIYLPFGIGLKTCIGYQFAQVSAKVALVRFFQKFQIEKCSLTEEPVFDHRLPFISPLYAIKMKITKL